MHERPVAHAHRAYGGGMRLRYGLEFGHRARMMRHCPPDRRIPSDRSTVRPSDSPSGCPTDRPRVARPSSRPSGRPTERPPVRRFLGSNSLFTQGALLVSPGVAFHKGFRFRRGMLDAGRLLLEGQRAMPSGGREGVAVSR